MDCNRRHAASRRAWIFIALLSAVPAAASAGSLRLARHHRARFAQARGLRQQDLPTDYLALVLSWSPEHCETQRNRPEGQRQKQSFQCFSGNRFEWVVHGLWPQNSQARSGRDHPRNCEAAGAVPASVLKQHLCMMPGVELMQNEWQAHGTCGWRSPERYFADIQAVYGTLHRPTVRDMAGKSADLSPTACSTPRRGRQAGLPAAQPDAAGRQPARQRGLEQPAQGIVGLPGQDLKPMACRRAGRPMGSGSRSGRQCSDSASLVAARMPGASGVARECVLAGYAPDLLLRRAADRPQYLSRQPRKRQARREHGHQGESNASAQDRNTPAMAGRQAGTAGRGKKLTRQGDEVARQRQALPWVRLDKTYRLQTDAGSATLADLFQGRSQLLVYHFMFGPDYKAGCPSCSSIADGFNGIVTHLAHHDVMLWAVSRAPLDNFRSTSGAWAGPSRGPRRPAAISTTTSMPRSPRPSSAKGRNTTSGATIPP